MGKEVVVIGGGIIGLCSAYYLHNEGHQVVVIDKSNMDAGASYVNAGYLSPSHIIPLSAPGVMKKGLKWMFNPSSPLYIRPRLNPDFLKWAWAFNKSCNAEHVKRSGKAIRDISVLSQELFQDIIKTEKFNSHYEKKGLLMLCQTEETLWEEIQMVKKAISLGLSAKEVSVNDIKQIESNTIIESIGGTYFECDHHSTPHEFMIDMKMHLKKVGVSFFTNEKVVDLEIQNGTISKVKTQNQVLSADEFVLAAGSWSAFLSKKIGLKLLLQAGKGYRINTQRETKIKVPAILAEAKVAVTPMNGFTRFAGTMEIAGISDNINNIRVNAIAKAVNEYYPEVELNKEEKQEAASGLRPLSPDGLPYIGKSLKCYNLTIATGHAMMGWSMGTATGKLVSEIISDRQSSLDLSPFHIDRKF
ncbi:NAD(P)/FAD-dependent oxidoreductase [Seonamhaeicola maritimus]|uniref:NAD(P)/FAD-dependent oxidoreductase n=1 Tax=Seonamhaeicola maritimus TaxID=2591822 RepID=UPI002493F1EA|nr:FAD-dependent oxidoreductase [Seonamhaeicola maritimus]